MKKPKPLDLSSCEEMSREEMLNMVAGATSDLDNVKSKFFDSGYQWVDSGTHLMELSKRACIGLRVGAKCHIGELGAYIFSGKCQYIHDQNGQQVLACSSSDVGGANWWDNFWNSDLEPQRSGCNGKDAGDSCSWMDKGSTFRGVCGYDYTTHYLLCAEPAYSGWSSATGALSARQAACLNRSPGERCWFVGDMRNESGFCRIDSFSWYKKLLACYTDIGSSGDSGSNSGNY